MRGMFIERLDIQILFGVGYDQAGRILRTSKDILGKERITLKEFCAINELNENDSLEFINTFLVKNRHNH